MMRILRPVTVLGCVTAAIMVGQQPTFEAASVKMVNLASHPSFGNSGGPGTADPGRVHLCCVGMFSLLMKAYDVELDQIIGPSWIMDNMGANLYQIDATMPAGTTRAQFQLMMRNLLGERFHLEVHLQKRNFPGYELVVAQGGPKLRESRPNSNDGIPDPPSAPKRRADGTLPLPPGPQMFTSLGRGMIIVQAQEKPISELMKGMGRLITQSLGEDPNDFASPKPRVRDNTGLTGKYDFTLSFSCDGCSVSAVNGGVPVPSNPIDSPAGLSDIFGALQRQLGLKLIKTKDIALDLVVVDHVEKIPTPN
jgi:uncharacterized protein (TIGR03435 family)